MIFTDDDAKDVEYRHKIATAAVPPDWEAATCDCGLGDKNPDYWAHWERRCWKAAVYTKLMNDAGLKIEREH